MISVNVEIQAAKLTYYTTPIRLNAEKAAADRKKSVQCVHEYASVRLYALYGRFPVAVHFQNCGISTRRPVNPLERLPPPM